MKFRFSSDFVIDSDVEPWCREGLRIAMLGGPGSGKSWNDALLAEQFLQQGGTVVIFQPRDEFYTLKEKFDILSVGGVHAKDMEFSLTSPSLYAKAVVEEGISMIFYTSAAEDEEKLIQWVSRFISLILKYQEQNKRPLLLILEEAQEYCPRSPSGHIAPPWTYNRMIKAFKDCFAQGRKLNIIAVASSQRPQELSFTVRQLANLTFYGRFSDQDINYIDKECLKYVRKHGVTIDAEKLVELGLGEWLVIMGSKTRFLKVTEARLTKHGAETPRLEHIASRPSETRKAVDELTRSLEIALQKEESEESELGKANRKIADLTKKLREAEDKANIKLSVKEMMEGNGDEGLRARIVQLTTELEAAKTGLDESVQAADLNGYSRGRAESEAELKEAKVRNEELETENKAFSTFKEALVELMPKTAALKQTVGLQNVVQIVDLEEKKISVKMDTASTKGKILKVAKGGFFGDWRTLGDVTRELLEKHGWSFSPQSIDGALGELVRLQIFGVKHGKKNSYKLADNVVIQSGEA